MVGTKLHELCSTLSDPSEQIFDGILEHLEANRADAKETDEYGRTPLFLVLRHRPPLEVVSAFLEAHPDAANAHDRSTGEFPLHVACRAGCHPPVVRLLLEKNPEALYHPHESMFLLKWFRGGRQPMDLAKALPKTDPNREGLIELLKDFDDDVDINDKRAFRHSASIFKVDESEVETKEEYVHYTPQ